MIEEGDYEPIHMPNNNGQPFIMGVAFFFFGFFMVFSWWLPAIIAGMFILGTMAYRTFEQDHGHYVTVEEIERTENALRGEKK